MIKAMYYFFKLFHMADIKGAKINISVSNLREAGNLKKSIALEITPMQRQLFEEPINLDRFTIYGIPVSITVRSE